MLEVELPKADIEALAPLIGDDRYRRLIEEAAQVLERIDGRRVWNVNSTAHGGGVVEGLPGLIEIAKRELDHRALAAALKPLRVVRSHLGADAGVIGNALFALEAAHSRSQVS